MRSTIVAASILSVLGLATIVGCGSSDEADETGSKDEDLVAREGQTCGNGTFGTPKIRCAAGFTCEYPESTAPSGPAGSSSALTGTCKRKAASLGQTCGNGVFGTPNIPCAEGLECKFPNDSTAPRGPAGSSSAATGTCQNAE